MLILSRRQHQRIVLTLTESLPAGATIVVLVSEIRVETVQIGLEAPKSVRILRSELEPEGGIK